MSYSSNTNNNDFSMIPISERYIEDLAINFRINILWIIIPLVLIVSIILIHRIIVNSSISSDTTIQGNQFEDTVYNPKNENDNPQKDTVANSFFEFGIVFPHSSTQYLNDSDIEQLYNVSGYTAEKMIHYAINELYARHHYHFNTDDEMIEFYNNCDWYDDYGYDMYTARELFNEYESSNLDFLVIELKKIE